MAKISAPKVPQLGMRPQVSTIEIIDVDAVETVEGETGTGNKRTLSILGAVLAVVLLAGTGGAYFLWPSLFHGAAKSGTSASASAASTEKSLIDVPPMLVNLHSSDGRIHLLKLHFMLVAADDGKVEALKGKLPVYVDALQPFLRELRPEDLNGSAAVYRVKEEMLSRAAEAFGDGAIHDVLIQDLIQQ